MSDRLEHRVAAALSSDFDAVGLRAVLDELNDGEFGRCRLALADGPLRVAIVTASDGNQAMLCDELLGSLAAALGHQCPAVSILDVGLSAADRDRLMRRGADIIDVGWDIELPATATPPSYFRAMVDRPFLARHVPGYDVYLWIDADVWVQQAWRLDWYVAIAAFGGLAAVREPEVRAPIFQEGGRSVTAEQWRKSVYREAFGPQAVALAARPMLNSGIIALRADAPHWQAWQTALAGALQRSQNHFVEQAALNVAVARHRLPTVELTSLYNWTLHLLKPKVDTGSGMLCAPWGDHPAIGLVHLSGPEKPSHREIDSLDGRSVAWPVRWGWQADRCRTVN